MYSLLTQGRHPAHIPCQHASLAPSDNPPDTSAVLRPLLPDIALCVCVCASLDLGATPKPVEGVADGEELAQRVRTHEATSSEVAALCRDLQVLGRTDFKALLKWCVRGPAAPAQQLAALADCMHILAWGLAYHWLTA